MHELSIAESIVSAVAERLGEERVRRVWLDLGALSGVVEEALRFAFDLCIKATPLEGAVLEVRTLPGLGECGACGRRVELDAPYGLCACGSPDLQIVQGRELRIVEVEVV